MSFDLTLNTKPLLRLFPGTVETGMTSIVTLYYTLYALKHLHRFVGHFFTPLHCI